MEPKFEVRFTATYKMLVEFARKYRTGPKLPLVIVFWVLYGLSVIPVCFDATSESTTVILFAGLGVIMLIVSFLPQQYARNAVRHAKKQNDGVVPETVVTFGETIEMREGMVRATVEYRKIVKVIRLKHSYMLMLGKRNGVMLDPNGFTKGSFEEFKQFLRVTRPDLRIPE